MPVASAVPGQCSVLPGPHGSAPGLRWGRVFPGVAREIPEMRHWLTALLPDCPARDDVTCVVTELSTNAVQHTASGRGGSFRVEVTWHPDTVRVAVADGGAPSGPHRTDVPGAEHGRGLLLLEGLASRSGVRGDHRGRLVWADIPWTAQAAPADYYEDAIRAGHASLAGQFAIAPAWFGHATRQWWALASGGLVAASSAQALARQLGPVLDRPRPGSLAAGTAA
jgi:serine/threonine-protein kinase RsbW